jgi:stress response protein YsnF
MKRYKGTKAIPLAITVLTASVAIVGCCSKNKSAHSTTYYSTPATAFEPEANAPRGGAETPTGQQAGGNMAIPVYEESLQVGKRDVTGGSVRIRKFSTTETVNQPLELTQEKVTVSRGPASGQPASGQAANPQSQPFQDQTFEIPLRSQEPMISKQVTAQGQVMVQVQTEVLHTNVQGQVRREQVQVTKQGDARNVNISPDLATPEAMGGGGEVGAQGRGASASGTAITDAANLTGADPASLAGRSVNLSDLKVQQVLGDHLVALSDSSGKPFYARVAQGAGALKVGDTVNLTGTIKSMPSSIGDLGLGDEASQALKGQSFYLDAQKLQPSKL